jgi:hypothetical protein
MADDDQNQKENMGFLHGVELHLQSANQPCSHIN